MSTKPVIADILELFLNISVQQDYYFKTEIVHLLGIKRLDKPKLGQILQRQLNNPYCHTQTHH